MRTMKRAAAVALSVVMLMTSGVSAKAAVTDVQPAKSSSEAVEKWAKQIGSTYETMTDLKVVGDYIYLAENANKRVVRLDKEYIENWNIGMDIKILLKTVLVVFKKDGSM